MAIVKAEGIVLKTMKFRETSKIVTLFTRQRGILKLNAKGARNSKSRFGAALEPLTLISIVYYDKETRDLQLLTQADIVERYSNIQHQVVHWGYASACCELVYKTQMGEEPNPKLFPILLDTLRIINISSDSRLPFWSFQMKLLGILGVHPSLHRCLNCENRLLAGEITGHVDDMSANIAQGGVYCRDCSRHHRMLKISGAAIRLLGEMQTRPAEKLMNYDLSDERAIEIERFCRSYYSYHLPELGSLDSLNFVRRMKSI